MAGRAWRQARRAAVAGRAAARLPKSRGSRGLGARSAARRAAPTDPPRLGAPRCVAINPGALRSARWKVRARVATSSIVRPPGRRHRARCRRSRAAESASRERREQRPRRPGVVVPENADLPGPGNPAPNRRERMYRKNGGRRVLGQHRLDLGLDRAAIGRPVQPPAALDLVGVDPRVARHDRAVGNSHDQRRVVGAAIGVDQQSRNRSRAPRERPAARRAARVSQAAPMS